MRVLCRLRGHHPSSRTFENQGFAFAKCRRCECDLMRSAAQSTGTWRPVPETLRVDWRDADPLEGARTSAGDRAAEFLRRLLALPRRLGSKLMTLISTLRALLTFARLFERHVVDRTRAAWTAVPLAVKSRPRAVRLPEPVAQPGDWNVVISLRLRPAGLNGGGMMVGSALVSPANFT